eukprot:TRINITY_DN13678_c0_g1_i1.p1 TRINITY_DN13678_c0_g1~~TRINITY_DN13678_c0_g1_i1.p1  ORF type:complete len:300 (+),score=53.40 TRINITY_DN13678_c0_g1_i1:65-901(+)
MDSSETRLRIAEYLSITDVARFQVIDVATKNSLEIDGVKNVWRYCAEFEFECLFASAALYEGPDRFKFLRFLVLLRRANFALCSPLCIADMEEATLIEGPLGKAADACDAYVAASGHDAHLLLGEFDLRNSIRSTLFAVGDMGKPPIAGLVGGFLKMKLVLDGSSLWSWAEYCTGGDLDELTPFMQAREVQLTFSVESADPDIFMSYRGVPLVLDGCWRSTTFGVCANRTASQGSAKRRSDFTMCAVSLFEGAPPDSDNSLMNALQLDAGQRSTWLAN